MSRANQWFIPADGIAREVITADIQRYLGPDALVRPGPGTGEYDGRPGYWITAYRTLTSQMIQDLKLDSQRWQQEQGRQESGRGGSPYARSTKVSRSHPDSSLVAYQDSDTHASRQHWGPSESFSGGRETEARVSGRSSSQYTGGEHYTTTPSNQYGSSHSAGYPVQQSPYASAPRTQPDPYAGYAQPGRERISGYPTQQQYANYGSAAAPNPYSQQPPPPHGYATAPSPVAPQPGYYIASDGRQYPLPQQPPQASGRRRP